MVRRLARIASIPALAAAVALAGCGDERAHPWASASASAPLVPASRAAPPPRPSASARPVTLELQRFRLTSNVEHKEPVDDLGFAETGQRIWAHATIRNRTGETKRVTLIFRVDGDERSTVDLKIEPSWSWRTWGYVTLRATDKEGVLTVELRDDKGELLEQKALTIRGKSGAAPR